MKVLVIRLKYIGDTLLSLPVCRSIKNNYPDAEVHYLMYEHITSLYQNDEGLEPGIDKLQVITPQEKKQPLKYMKKLRQLRAEKYDVVIDTLTVPATVLISRFTGAKCLIGFDKGKLRSKWYTHKIPHVPNVSPMKQKLQLLRALPLPENKSKPIEFTNDMQLHFSAKETDDIRTHMQQHGINLNKPIIMLSPIARVRFKLWPEGYFIELANWLLANYDAQLLIVWGPGEHAQAQAIRDNIDESERVFCDIKSNIREMGQLASQCAIYIGNDTGPRHIAEASGIPTFTIFSPVYSRHVWIPNPGEQHQAIDLTDILNIGFDDHLLDMPMYEENLDHYFRMVTPQKVIDKLSPMLQKCLNQKPNDDSVAPEIHGEIL